MKHLLFILLAVSCCNAFAQITYDPDYIDKIAESERKQRKLQADGIELASSSNYDLKYANIRLDAARLLNGNPLTGEVVYTLKRSDTAPKLEFDLSAGMNVSAVLFNGIATTFTHTNDILSIVIPSSPVQKMDTLDIAFFGSPSASGFGSLTVAKQGVDSVPVLWTLSEPYGARDWLPCKMTLTDKLDSFDIAIQTLGNFKALSNGLLTSVTSDVSGDYYHWHHSYPIANYLVAVALTNYDTFSRVAHTSHGDVKIRYYHYPQSKAEWESEAINVVNPMILYDSLFGAYPFIREQYGQTQFNWAGGMEHQSNSFMYNLNFDLAAHELAHQWFGDKLTCASWKDIWLNEGFANYCSGLTYQHYAPQYWYIFRKSNQERACRVADGSVIVDDTTSVGRIFSSLLSYSKGSYILHMLRWQLGDELFFSSLRKYLNDPKLAYNFTGTRDLQHHLEASSGRDFKSFFDKWVYGKGYPSYTLLWSKTDNRIDAQLFQTTSDPSVSFFEMPVPVYLKDANWDTTIVLNHTYSGQQWNWTFSQKVDSVFFDPELWILSANNSSVQIPDVNDAGAVQLFPNPAKKEIKLLLNAEVSWDLDIKIFDESGKLVLENKPANGMFLIVIPVADLQKGTYLCEILSAKNFLRSIHFVKE